MGISRFPIRPEVDLRTLIRRALAAGRLAWKDSRGQPSSLSLVLRLPGPGRDDCRTQPAFA